MNDIPNVLPGEDTPADASSAEPQPTVSLRQFLQLFVAIVLPLFLAVVDQTLLATATPPIAAEFKNIYDSSWIATVYLFTNAISAPVYGRLGDRYGRRKVLVWAVCVFVLGSLACAASQSMGQLIAGRTLQGMGGGGLISLCMALMGESIPPRQRMRFVGYFVIMDTTALVIGPAIGGLVVAHASWRWLFFVNLPIGVLGIWLLMRLPQGLRNPASPGISDAPGLVLFVTGILAVLFAAASGGHRFEWFSWPIAALFAGGIVCGLLLVWHEKRLQAPFFPIDLFGIKVVRQSLLTVVCAASCLVSLVFYLPVYLQLGLHVDAARAGLLLTPLTAGQICGNVLSSRIVSRFGKPKFVPVCSLSVGCVALLLLSLGPRHLWIIGILAFFTGTGLGPAMPVTQVTVQTVCGKDRLGAATALFFLVRMVSASLGTAAVGALVYGLLPGVDIMQLLHGGVNGGAMANDAYTGRIVHAFDIAFLCMAVLAALGALNASRVPAVKL